MKLRALAAAPLIALTVLYRRLISPVLPRACRFQPTCSAYALTAWRRYGPIYGSWLSARRVLRCRPGHPGGYDPVPGVDDGRLAMITPSAAVQTSLRRLHALWPLAAAQAALSAGQRRTHRLIINTLARTGRAPDAEALAAAFAGYSLDELAGRGLVVLDGDALAAAHPVGVAVTRQRVALAGRWVYASGALAALAVAPMFEADARVAAACPVSGAAIRIEQMNLTVLSVTPPTPVVGIVWRATGASGVETVLLRDQATGRRWRSEAGADTSLLSLEDAVLLGALLFKPLVVGAD